MVSGQWSVVSGQACIASLNVTAAQGCSLHRCKDSHKFWSVVDPQFQKIVCRRLASHRETSGCAIQSTRLAPSTVTATSSTRNDSCYNCFCNTPCNTCHLQWSTRLQWPPVYTVCMQHVNWSGELISNTSQDSEIVVWMQRVEFYIGLKARL